VTDWLLGTLPIADIVVQELYVQVVYSLVVLMVITEETSDRLVVRGKTDIR